MSDNCNKDATEPVVEARAWTAGEVIERAKGAVTEHCHSKMKPAGRSEMYRDCIHACLDQLRAHMGKPPNESSSATDRDKPNA